MTSSTEATHRGGARPLVLPTLLRVAVSIFLLAAPVVALTVASGAYRGFEASLVAAMIGPLVETDSSGTRFLVAGNADQLPVWFTITEECTSALLVMPLVVFAAWAAVQRKFRLADVLAALALALGAVLLVNTTRLGIIGLGWHAFGGASYWTTHSLIGTLISLTTVFFALAVQLRMSVWRDRSVRRTFDDGEEVA